MEKQNYYLWQGRLDTLEELIFPFFLDQLLLPQSDYLKVLEKHKKDEHKGDGGLHDEYDDSVLWSEGGHSGEKGQEYGDNSKQGHGEVDKYELLMQKLSEIRILKLSILIRLLLLLG